MLVARVVKAQSRLLSSFLVAGIFMGVVESEGGFADLEPTSLLQPIAARQKQEAPAEGARGLLVHPI